MAVVIRLQGLPVVAGSSDIRRFFSGLDIPDGGVHIIGGEKGEAFIIFATDEDARRGMSYSGYLIKDSRIELFLSSKAEMQHIIEVNRKRSDHSGRETVTGSRRAGSSSSGVGNLSNLVAAIKKGIGKSSYGSMDHLEKNFHSDGSQNSDTEVSKSASHQSKKESFNTDSLYVFIRGMPFSASKEDVLNFFSGLQVEGVILLEHEDGRQNGDGVVKFATSSDATKGLQRDREYMGTRFIEVRPSNKGTWLKHCRRDENMDHSFKRFAQLNKESFSNREHGSRRESSYVSSRKQSLSRSPPRRYLAHSRSRSPRRFFTNSRSRSPPRRGLAHSSSRSPRRRSLARTHSRSPLRTAGALSHSPVSHSTLSYSSNREFYIHIKNLSPAVEKKDLRAFFGALDVPSHHITFLKSNNSHEKKREAFMLFRSFHEYQTALKYHKASLFGEEVHLFPASKKSVLELIESSESKRSSERHHHVNEKKDGCSSQKTCVYVRNFPFDVTKVEVQKFFAGFSIDNSDIHLLYDDKGVGLGEALVKFRSEEHAQKAESLNRRRFLGTEVLLRCIPEEQMQEFGINISSVSSEKMHGQPHAHARGEHFYEVGSQGPSVSSQGPPMQGNLRHPTDYRCPDDFLCSPDQFRGPPPFPEFHGEANPGGFPEGRFMPDSNFSGGSDRITLIKLKNIPFRAAPNEILDFFHGYRIIPESLSIHQNEYGMPSGEATLALVNYNEALAAVDELNDRPFGHRKVRVTLV